MPSVLPTHRPQTHTQVYARAHNKMTPRRIRTPYPPWFDENLNDMTMKEVRHLRSRSSTVRFNLVGQTRFKTGSFHHLYEVGVKLGQGGFGKVYQGLAHTKGSQVAIKQVPRPKVPSWAKVARRKVPLEINLLLKLQDVPGVVKLIDFFERKDSFIFVMEKKKNVMDLFDFISEKEILTEDLARNFFTQTLNIVLACHAKGIVHKDIKDENLLVDLDTNEIILIDFGSGGYVSQEDCYRYEGTRCYAPPEWISHHRYQDERLTVWSLGILLFNMVGGDVPFKEDFQIKAGLICVPKLKVSKSCWALLQGLLEVDEMARMRLDEVKHHGWIAGRDRSDSGYLSQ